MRPFMKNCVYFILATILLNIVSYFIFIRLDFTANGRYSLSSVSKSIIKANKQPIVVDFFVSENLPPEMKKLAKEFKAILKEYKSLSTVDFTINTIYTNSSEKKAKASGNGIQSIYKEFNDNEMLKIREVLLGAVFHIGNHRAIIKSISYTTPIEYEITRFLRQANTSVRPYIGFVKGHREATSAQMSGFINELFQLTEVKTIDLQQDESLNDFNVLCIIAPQEVYSSTEIERLEEYLKNGGRLFIALNHAVGQINEHQNNGFINRTGIEDMLEEKGLKIKYDFVIDRCCGKLSPTRHFLSHLQKHSFSSYFPYFPNITNFSEHAVTKELSSMLLFFASSIEQVRTQTPYIYEELARSSSTSGVQQAPIFFNLYKQWTLEDFKHPYNTVAALLTNNDDKSAIITITDADFIFNDSNLQGYNDNMNFAINSIEWLADNSGLIQLRNKFTTFTSLDPISERMEEILKYLNFFLPILIVVSAAIVIYKRNQRKRMNRSIPGHID